jgi:hypothetical protein
VARAPLAHADPVRRVCPRPRIGDQSCQPGASRGIILAGVAREGWDPAAAWSASLVELARAAAPVIVATGAATAEEIGMETLEQRLRDERHASRAVSAGPMLLSARATTSGPLGRGDVAGQEVGMGFTPDDQA